MSDFNTEPGQAMPDNPGNSNGNTNNGNWRQPQQPQTQQPQPQRPQDRDWRDVFFGWVRRSELYRTDDRYLGGVCAGIAHRMGWNPAIVRAIAIILTFCVGFGVYAYVFAWLLMPDLDDEHIIAEDVLHGGDGWERVFAPVAMFLVAFLIMPWMVQGEHPWRINGSIAIVALALVLAMFNAVAYRSRRPRQQNQQQRNQQMPMQGNPGYAPYQSAPNRPARPMNQSSYPRAAAMPPYRPAPTPKTRYVRTRRKPAGPLLVLSAFGLVLVSAALVVLWWASHNGGEPQLTTMISGAAGWIGCVCIALGALLIVLGTKGRRTGGLHPLVWLSAFIAAVMVFTAGVAGYCLNDIQQKSKDYATVDVNGTVELGSERSTLRKLHEGVTFQGSSFDNDKVVIDLSDYGKRYGTHTFTDIHNDYRSYCPTGTFNIRADHAQVEIKLPRYCTFGYSMPGGGVMQWWDSVGSKYELVDSGIEHVGFEGISDSTSATQRSGFVANPTPTKSSDSSKSSPSSKSSASSKSSKSSTSQDDSDSDDEDSDVDTDTDADDDTDEDSDNDYGNDYTDDYTDSVTRTELKINVSAVQGKVSVSYAGRGKGYVRIYPDTSKKENTK